MKRKTFGSDDIITVYKFMARCGLECPTHGNINVSHEIMMRKLRDRHDKFPTKVIVPRVVPFKRITKDDVKRGTTILVVDDCKKIQAYSIDRNILLATINIEDRESIRQKYIKEAMEDTKEEIIKPGFVKYLKRKAKKMEG